MLFKKASLLVTSAFLVTGCTGTFYIDVKNMTDKPVAFVNAEGSDVEIAPDASSKQVYNFHCIRFKRGDKLYEFNSDVAFPLRYEEGDLIEDGFHGAIVASEEKAKKGEKPPLRFLMDDGLRGTIALKAGCPPSVRKTYFTDDLANF